jgi:hypothetical protein
MDMLQVGRGMTYEEDKSHFSMWSMMCSPLLAGNDLTTMSKQTFQILTNKEIIALNQDPLVYQARRLKDYGDLEVWAKPLISTVSGEVAVALLNRSARTAAIRFNVDSVGIDSKKGYSYRDLWRHKDFALTNSKELIFDVPSHGIVVLRLHGTARPINVFQFK